MIVGVKRSYDTYLQGQLTSNQLLQLPTELLNAIFEMLLLPQKSLLMLTCKTIHLVLLKNLNQENSVYVSFIRKLQSVIGIAHLNDLIYKPYAPPWQSMPAKKQEALYKLSMASGCLTKDQLGSLSRVNCNSMQQMYRDVIVTTKEIKELDPSVKEVEFLKIFETRFNTLVFDSWIHHIQEINAQSDRKLLNSLMKIIGRLGELEKGLKLLLSLQINTDHMRKKYSKMIKETLEYFPFKEASNLISKIKWEKLEDPTKRENLILETVRQLISSYNNEIEHSYQVFLVIYDTHIQGEWVNDFRIVTAFNLIRKVEGLEFKKRLISIAISQICNNQWWKLLNDHGAMNETVLKKIGEHSGVEEKVIMSSLIHA